MYEGALALGATKDRAVFFTVLPAAGSGIFCAIVLGLGRAVGETMAIMMVAGNQAVLPNGLLGGVRTLTSNIAMEMGIRRGFASAGAHWHGGRVVWHDFGDERVDGVGKKEDRVVKSLTEDHRMVKKIQSKKEKGSRLVKSSFGPARC